MKITAAIKRFIISIIKGFKRFPASLFLTAVLTVLLIIISEMTGRANSSYIKTLTRIAMVLALGVPVSVCIKLVLERYENINISARLITYISAVLLLILYYFFLLPDESMVPLARYISFNIAVYLIMLVIPYYFSKENFELYIIRIIANFLTTIVFSLVIFMGISAILFTIEKLFDINVYNKLYLYTWIVTAGIFAPSYFLSVYPEYNFIFDTASYSKFLKILLLYIAMPIISVYTFILYMYLFKVALTARWPVGIVGNLVLWYSLISTLVIFLIWPLLSSNRWVKTFVFWFTKLIFPLVIIMFASLGIRIKAYGITENRYFVIVIALWVIGIMLYWNLKKVKRNIILPISLSAVAFLSVFGPWSAYSVSISSQNRRFKSIVSKYNMISGGVLIKPSGPISGDDEKELIAIISYFDRNHSLKNIKYLPSGFTTNNMKNIFGFEYNPGYYNPDSTKYFSYYLYNTEKPYDISGYDYLFSFRPKGTVISQSGSGIKAEYNNESNKVIVYSNNQIIYQNDFKNIADKLYSKYDISGNTNITQDEMTFTDENDSLKIRLIIYGIYGNRNSATDTLKIDSVDFDMLVKIK